MTFAANELKVKYMKPTRYYLLKNDKGEYLAHKGADKWTKDVKLAHVLDSQKTPREQWDTQKSHGETVTTEDW